MLNKQHETPARSLLQAPKAWWLGVLLGFQLLTAYAQTAAPSPSACDIPLAGQTIDAALALLRPLERQCHKHAPFLYIWGRLLNQAGYYEAAIDPLEGAILYAPDHWPSQLEYAIALEGIGDHDSALSQIQSLLQQPGIDPVTREQLLALQRRPARSLRLAGRRTVGLAMGYDSNLLSSTYHTEFTLTTPEGPLPVALLQDQRPQAGAFARAELSYDGLLASSDTTQWRYSLFGSYRANPSLASANRLQLGAFVEGVSAGGQGPYLLAQHQTLLRAGATALRQTQLGGGYDFALGAALGCQQRLGLDLQHLSYPSNPELGGRYTGLVGVTACPTLGLQVLVRTGQDQPLQSGRPGGAQRQSSLRVSKRTTLNGGSLALEWEATRQQDQAGFSVLLASNARREIKRFAYRLEYSWQLGALSPYVGVEWQEQRSNLRLFEFKNWVTTLGFRSVW